MLNPARAAALTAEATAALEADPPFRVCVHVLGLFPKYLANPGEQVLRDFLSARAAQVDATVMEEIGAVFVRMWRRKPRSRYWYGDLRQSFVPHALQQRLATVPAVHDQLVEDFREIAPGLRGDGADLGCRRLERAGELLLHAPSEACRAVMLPIVQLDYVDRQKTRPFHRRYDGVYWAMVRVLRKVGEDL